MMPSSDDLRTRLRDEPAPVRYDVPRGLARHRALVEAGAPLPDWASTLPKRTSWIRRVAWLGGTLALVALVWLRAAPTPEPYPKGPRADAAPPMTVRAPEHTATVPRAGPKLEPVPAPQIAAREEALVEAPAVSAEREPPAAQPRSARLHARPRVRGAESASMPSRNVQSAEIVAPQENLELSQLVEAERALASDPVRALRLAREGELAFRNGYFPQERRYIEVMALFALGRLGEAHAQAAAFLRDYPNAAYRRKVELELLRHPQH
jgi:hypothetical protein